MLDFESAHDKLLYYFFYVICIMYIYYIIIIIITKIYWGSTTFWALF